MQLLNNSPLVCIAVLAAVAAAAPPYASLERRAACTADQEALADGIDSNIADQQDELSAVKAIASALGQPNMNDATFKPLKDKLVGFVNKGVTIRAANQKIASKINSKAVAGLATVEKAQAAELKLATDLTGKPATDNANVKTLQKDFEGGITQNQQNKKDALDGCVRTKKQIKENPKDLTHNPTIQ